MNGGVDRHQTQTWGQKHQAEAESDTGANVSDTTV